MADEATNDTATQAAGQTATTETTVNGNTDAAIASANELVVGVAEPEAASVVAPTHVETAFTDRAVLLFEELIRHIKSEETALVGGVSDILAAIVEHVRS